MSDNGGNTCPNAQLGCPFKTENLRFLMDHEDYCQFKPNLNDQQTNLDLYYTNVKPQNPVIQVAPNTYRNN